MILCLLFLVVTLWTILFKLRKRRVYKMISTFPRPKSELPVIGLAHKLAGNTEDIMTNLKELSYEALEHNGLLGGWLGYYPYIFLANPVDLEILLKTCLEKDHLHRFLRKLIGYGGIFAPVSIWRRRRKILLPGFSPKIVEGFVEVFSRQSKIMTRNLANMCGSSKFHVWPFVSAYTLDSVCETTMGVTVNAQTISDQPFLNSLAEILNIICKRTFHLWLHPDWLFKFFPEYSRHQKCIQTIHAFIDQVIQKKRIELQNRKQSQTEADLQYDLNDYQRKSFLDLLITLSGGEKGYTDVELREEILTLSIAGTDTSAVCICFTLILLSKYPKVQQQLYEEIQKAFGGSDRKLVKEDLNNLKYLDRVVKECLRLFPPVPFIIRKVDNEFELPTGHTVPGGSGVVISIWGCHRDPKYWGPDAEHFDPDRFLPERFKLEHPCSFMPFSNGPRNCLGYQYAMMSIKTAVTTIIRDYKFVGESEIGPVPNIRVKFEIMMRAVDNYQVKIEKRRPYIDIMN